MRVLLVANTLPPDDLSGVGEQVLQLATGLGLRGHEVRILGRGGVGARGPKLLFPLMIVVPFLRELGRFRPEVVQFHESDGAFAALALEIVRSFMPAPPRLVALLQVSYVQERRAVRPIRHQHRVLGRPSWVERRFRWLKAPMQIVLGCLTAWLADRVLAPSRATATELERDYRVADVAVVPNAMDPDRAGSGRVASAQADGERHAPFLFVGRLRLRKGLEVALHAVAALTDAPEPLLAIVGDGEHRVRLERVAAELGLGGRVEFLGRQPREEVDRRMAQAKALVVPSLYEGMPLVIVEAMGCCLPVIASAVSGIPEVVVDGETGWLVPSEDPEGLAAAMRAVLADPTEARSRGVAGRKRLELEFSPQAVGRLWERALGTDAHAAATEGATK